MCTKTVPTIRPITLAIISQFIKSYNIMLLHMIRKYNNIMQHFDP
jgi:hypothetical protein